MRVKSLTPPLPSVLPMTATTSSALNWPARIRSSRPEASCTCLRMTFATSIAIARTSSAPGPAHRSRDGSRHDALAEEQIDATRDDDADEPAQVGAAEQLGRDRTLQRGNEAVFDRPAGHQTHDERHDGSPVDVAVGAPLRLAIELVDVDAAPPHDEEVGQDD